ncbi:hypothetical protein CIPAW_08G162100 [Carya illinoinensis]|uniref:Stress-related protein n=1 Tax=Carya illinoinensis TaxID=32201 RepID=A0A8T1PYZ8_CARIL|nr:hypothetical protein CIPAW_08G162100 [Carya illinoinensis]
MVEEDLRSQAEMRKEEDDGEQRQLKYLEFVQVATIHAMMCFSNLYCYAKDKAGPLKPGVETVEGTVKSVVGPVYDMFHDVPIEVLLYVDRKVEASVTELNRHVPPIIKQASSQAFSAAQSAPEVARAVASEVKRSGVVDTASAYCTEKYNQTVRSTAEKGYRVSSYLPLVPTERIAKVFSGAGAESEPLLTNDNEATVAAH